MDRKKFLKTSVLGSVASIVTSKALNATQHADESSTYDVFMHQVGFNHLPNNEERTMKSVLHRANTRGHANHGWLHTHHTFSFANYQNPERMHFGVLRVLNDDRVAGGKGFGKHPHDNMEIISIPLEGDLEHQDSMGNVAVIHEGDVQVMSAGAGIYHSEYNKNMDEDVKFLQIWMFPREKNVEPRYDQISTSDVKKTNTFYQVLSPSKDDEGVWVHQDAWFHLGEFEVDVSDEYMIKKPGNGVYLFVLEGEVEVGGHVLGRRDGMGLWDTERVILKAISQSKVLLMDVPMTL